MNRLMIVAKGFTYNKISLIKKGEIMKKIILMTLTFVAAIPLSTFAVMTQKDMVVYRGAGTWEAEYSTLTGFGDGGTADTSLSGFGIAGATPLVGDVNGDGVADMVTVTPAASFNWKAAHSTVDGSRKGLMSQTTTSASAGFGTVAGSDGNLLGDINGDGRQDIITINSGFNWYTQLSTASGIGGTLQGPAQFGLAGDQPICGDFDGDGNDDIGIYRHGGGNIYWNSSAGGVIGAGALGPIGQIGGAATDSLIIGNLNGDAYDDAVMVRQDGAGLITWYGLINDGTGDLDYGNPGTTIRNFGLDGTDTPMLGDINGDGMDDIIVNRGGTHWYTTFTTAGGALGNNAAGDDDAAFGTAGDTPLLGKLKLDLNCTWTGGSGDWSDAANWENGVPNGDTAIAHFTNSTSSDATLDIAAAVANLYSSRGSHSIGGNNKLTVHEYVICNLNSTTRISCEIYCGLEFMAGIAASRGTVYLENDADIEAQMMRVGIDSSVEAGNIGSFYLESGSIFKTARAYNNSGTGLGEGSALYHDGGTFSDGTYGEVEGSYADWIQGGLSNVVQDGGARIEVNSTSREITNPFIHDPALGGTADGGLRKLGTGTLKLSSANNNYTGPTTVSAGKLIVNGDISDSSLVSVASGAIVGGTGTLPNISTFSGATVSPGNSIGTLNTSRLDMKSGSFYEWEYSESSSDLIDIDGWLFLPQDDIGSVEVIISGNPPANTTKTLISYSSGLNGDLDSLYADPVNGNEVEFQFNGSNIEIHVTPEPGMFLGLILAGLAILRKRV